MQPLNQLGQSLIYGLATAKQASIDRRKTAENSDKIHVVGAGGILTAAYEQLRNAAEYTEEHVLLQRAIRRFYRRLFLLRDEPQIKQSGEELTVELTHAGYIDNDSVTETIVQTISELSVRYFACYQKLQTTRGVSHTEAEEWTVNVLSVEIEALFHDYGVSTSYLQFAYEYFSKSIDIAGLFDGQAPADSDTALYIAAHRALLKSDFAAIRFGLLSRYRQAPESLHYVESNRQITTWFNSTTTDRLYHVIDRRGAPFRILRHIVEEQPNSDELLARKDSFLSVFESQVATEYQSANERINRGIVKSVIFLVITKFLIGLAIEVPYDKLALGAVAWIPLLINLLFPPFYMILLRATLVLPGSANTRRLVEQIERILYSDESSKQLTRRSTRSFGTAYNIVYAIVFIIVFGGVAWLLWASFHFEILHLLIFFTFLSAASFLGFRLSRIIRELEAVDSQQTGLTTLRDFLYMPFVVVGRWMSDKYAKVNIVAMTLDMVIELPLKTVLRLVRQWGAFISSKKDEL